MNIDVNLNDASDITCKKCEGLHFTSILRLKKISSVISPTGETIVVPIQLWQCEGCGEVDEAMLA